LKWAAAELPRHALNLAYQGRVESEEGTDMTDVKDSNGTKLADGNSVTLIKDLKVKGTSVVLKRGTLIKNIRLTNKEGEIECNAEKVRGLVLRTEFLKKA
jgi:protein PhnA